MNINDTLKDGKFIRLNPTSDGVDFTLILSDTEILINLSLADAIEVLEQIHEESKIALQFLVQ